jgi:hypothetical protein
MVVFRWATKRNRWRVYERMMTVSLMNSCWARCHAIGHHHFRPVWSRSLSPGGAAVAAQGLPPPLAGVRPQRLVQNAEGAGNPQGG